jgi:hypothetical protein
MINLLIILSTADLLMVDFPWGDLFLVAPHLAVFFEAAPLMADVLWVDFPVEFQEGNLETLLL